MCIKLKRAQLEFDLYILLFCNMNKTSGERTFRCDYDDDDDENDDENNKTKNIDL